VANGLQYQRVLHSDGVHRRDAADDGGAWGALRL